MPVLTTQDVADRLKIDRDIAYKLVSFLADMEFIGVKGIRKVPGAKGKGATEYEIDIPACAEHLVKALSRLK